MAGLTTTTTTTVVPQHEQAPATRMPVAEKVTLLFPEAFAGEGAAAIVLAKIGSSTPVDYLANLIVGGLPSSFWERALEHLTSVGTSHAQSIVVFELMKAIRMGLGPHGLESLEQNRDLLEQVVRDLLALLPDSYQKQAQSILTGL